MVILAGISNQEITVLVLRSAMTPQMIGLVPDSLTCRAEREAGGSAPVLKGA